jgi:hypothetical protein
MGNTDGFCITALVLGIVSVLLGWIPILGLLVSIGALAFGLLGLKHLKLDLNKQGKGFAIAGIVLGSLGILWGIYTIIGLVYIMTMFYPLA